jgi:hypothetical protein
VYETVADVILSMGNKDQPVVVCDILVDTVGLATCLDFRRTVAVAVSD